MGHALTRRRLGALGAGLLAAPDVTVPLAPAALSAAGRAVLG